MIVLVNLLLSAINIYFYILIVSVFMSWVPSIKESGFGQMISKITDPYLDIFRRFIPPIGMIDISPIVAIFTLSLASQGIVVLANYFI
ncbi:YggT family protein [Microbacterium sp. APC 3898]|uniref:YggT family protein n=2 Tax=Planococcus TaxID=1372 RepID=A0ABT7ZFZ4_9BACL|nr:MULTISPECIES: YggT family protein [Terrabacteria group]MBD8013779.1 YggT family protein [Planococcus wigleyi]MDN3426082.1 YggT family protein [Planococcus sp. APC 4016]MDN3437676.1 YggT family protein [Planococcus sp. APC 3900]MDN3497779.1 YggT family protein [Microbacterium sp. APC 3898]